MAHHHRALDTQELTGGDQQRGLSFWRPSSSPRSLAEPISGTVEGDDSMMCREAVEHAAALKIARHDAVPVKQDDGCPAAAFEKVEADSIHIEEPAGRRMSVFGPSSSPPHQQNSGRREGDGGQ
jgi:hypothetical protein